MTVLLGTGGHSYQQIMQEMPLSPGFERIKPGTILKAEDPKHSGALLFYTKTKRNEVQKHVYYPDSK